MGRAVNTARLGVFIALGLTVGCAANPTPTSVVPLSPVVAVTPAPTSTLPPAQTPTPTLTPTQTLTPTPAPVLRQLTTGGCCVQPFWSPDGSQVWFIDRPDPNGPSGVWGVNVSGGEPQLITDRVGVYSPDGSLIAYPEAGKTYIERLALSGAEGGGERWVISRTAGRAVSFSPDSRLILWQAASSAEDFDRRVVEVWIANVDGTGARRSAQLIGGGVSGWFPDSARLLINGRESLSADPYLAALDLTDGRVTIIARGARLRGGTLSSEGGWVAYQITFSGDPAQDGLWVARTDGSGARKLEVFGAYRWRSEGRLWVIPLEADAASHRLLEVDAASGQVRALTDPAVTPFRIAGGDWSPAPDGNRVVFVSAEDHNLWVIELPPSS
jgi:hypothetical protein